MKLCRILFVSPSLIHRLLLETSQLVNTFKTRLHNPRNAPTSRPRRMDFLENPASARIANQGRRVPHPDCAGGPGETRAELPARRSHIYKWHDWKNRSPIKVVLPQVTQFTQCPPNVKERQQFCLSIQSKYLSMIRTLRCFSQGRTSLRSRKD